MDFEIAQYLDEALSRFDHLPPEIAHILREIRDKECRMAEIARNIIQLRRTYARYSSNPSTPASQERRVRDSITALHARISELSDEKIELANKLLSSIDGHVYQIDADLAARLPTWKETVKETSDRMGEYLASLLRRNNDGDETLVALVGNTRAILDSANPKDEDMEPSVE